MLSISMPHSGLKFSLSALLALVLCGACASPGPYDPIRDADFKGAKLDVVRADPQNFINLPVRWGGEIARVENRAEETLVEIVQHELSSNGRPRSSNDSEGRFIARIPGFLDPAIYAEGRQLTVTGSVESTLARQIGEHPYTFPVVAVNRYQLWEPRRERDIVYYPAYYGYHNRYGLIDFFDDFPHRRHYYRYRHRNKH